MPSTNDLCRLCLKEKYKYSCPKCGISYCSVSCYRSTQHLKCSEEFYKSCIQDEINSGETKNRDDVRKIYEILERMRKVDAGEELDDLNNGDTDPLDSDDDDELEENGGDHDYDDGEDNEDEGDVDDMAARLQGVDINNSDEVWQRLTAAERQEFQQMIGNGDIMKLIPNYTPWWIVKMKSNSKIVEIPSKDDEKKGNTVIPDIEKDIPKFSDICKKAPSSCLHYNLWNILTSYACTVRYFNGEHLSNTSEAAAHLVNLSSTLKYGTNFEDAEDAIISVEMEALTTGNIVDKTLSVSGPNNLFVESREQLQSDARQLMITRSSKLRALSDILRLMKLAKKQIGSNGTGNADFQKLFALCSGSTELDRKKLLQLVKKIEFMLSYVNREEENNVK